MRNSGEYRLICLRTVLHKPELSDHAGYSSGFICSACGAPAGPRDYDAAGKWLGRAGRWLYYVVRCLVAAVISNVFVLPVNIIKAGAFGYFGKP